MKKLLRNIQQNKKNVAEQKIKDASFKRLPRINGCLDTAYRQNRKMPQRGLLRPPAEPVVMAQPRDYLLLDNWLEVYFGRLNKDFTVRGEENELLWIDISSDFFDVTQFAGRGNMGHIMELIKEYESDLPDEGKY